MQDNDIDINHFAGLDKDELDNNVVVVEDNCVVKKINATAFIGINTVILAIVVLHACMLFVCNNLEMVGRTIGFTASRL